VKHRSRIHLFQVAAARLKEDNANPELVSQLLQEAARLSSKKAQGQGWTKEDEARVSRQRNVFTMMPDCAGVDRFKEAMMQRAYDLLWDGFATECDAVLEFLPSKDADAVLNAWDNDQDEKKERSRFYEGWRP
jgi:hypothetical protein